MLKVRLIQVGVGQIFTRHSPNGSPWNDRARLRLPIWRGGPGSRLVQVMRLTPPSGLPVFMVWMDGCVSDQRSTNTPAPISVRCPTVPPHA